MNEVQLAYARMAAQILGDYDRLAKIVFQMSGEDPLNILPKSYMNGMPGDQDEAEEIPLETTIIDVQIPDAVSQDIEPVREPTPLSPVTTETPEVPSRATAPPPVDRTQVMTTLTDNRPKRDRLLEAVRLHPGKTSRDLAERVECAPETAANLLRLLAEEKPPLIHRRGERGRGTTGGYTWYPSLPPISR